MKVSLIITTYNWPEALRLTLMSALNQSRLPDEIIIADDGSTVSTKKCIHEIAKISPIPIIHSWQEDNGFRAAMARNKAIASSSGEYIIMIDGDMILDKDFIADHIAISKRGVFIQGSRVLLDKNKTQEALSKYLIKFNFFSKGLKNRKNAIKCKILSKLFSKTNRTLKGIKTCNFSLFKEDILKVNGFDNTFIGWGREDSEFAVRLINAGILRKNLKFAGIAYHLYHKENTKNSLPQNDLKLKKSIDEKLKRCEDGIEKFINKEN